LVTGEVRWTRPWQVFRQWPRRRGARRLPRQAVRAGDLGGL